MVDRVHILEEKCKGAFTTLCVKCNKSILANLGVDSKYESIEREQDVIGTLNLVKGVMLKFDGKTEPTHMM